ncbi:hypothetical protein C8R42DRAFT_179578 [Lentinula raphanica]|nr:hypothetical protein C8R42DRAFT_179578 [Lentinula raphanica]
MSGPTTIYVRQLNEPTESQVDAIVDICVNAYRGDVSTKVFTGNNPALDEPMWRAMVRAGFHSGTVYVATDDSIDSNSNSNSIMSVGVWFGPGNVLYMTEDQRALGYTDFFRRVSPGCRDWMMRDFSPKVRQFKNRALGETTERNSWYCNVLATHPNYQRRGFATAIIKTVCARAAVEGVPICLGTQSEKNALFYRHRGLREVGKMDEPTPWGVITGNVFILEPSVDY